MSNECEGCDRLDCRERGCVGHRLSDYNPTDSDVGMAITEVEIITIRYLVKALQALQHASLSTKNGFASDYCDNAADQIRKAIRTVGG